MCDVCVDFRRCAFSFVVVVIKFAVSPDAPSIQMCPYNIMCVQPDSNAHTKCLLEKKEQPNANDSNNVLSAKLNTS